MKAAETIIKVSIVDDDERLRVQLVRTVNRFKNCRCLSEYVSAEDAIDGIPGDAPDVVLMDINLGGMSGIECVGKLKARHPEIEFIMLTVYQDTESIFNSLAAGASGYVLKRAAGDELEEAIDQVLQGGSPMTGPIARLVVRAFLQPAEIENETDKLSPREQQVLELLAEGQLYKEIADQLEISYSTVHNYIRRIYQKLQVRSRAQAVKIYFDSRNPPGPMHA